MYIVQYYRNKSDKMPTETVPGTYSKGLANHIAKQKRSITTYGVWVVKPKNN